MSCLTAFLLSLAFITESHGLSPAALDPVIKIPVPSNPPTLQFLNLSKIANYADLVNATSGEVNCVGQRYGYNLNKTSCDEVWKRIPTDSRILSFGARTVGTFERPLPYRYLSDDGLCAIDVDIMNSFGSDTATNHDISTAAKSILDKCVFRDVTKTVYESIGGVYPGVGRHSGLKVKVSSYSPTVKCEPGLAPPDIAACLNLMGTMQTGKSRVSFVRKRDPTRIRNLIVPKRVASATGLCTAVIDLEEGEADISSWHEMWMAAEAVNEICIQNDKAGTAHKIGQDETLMLSLRSW